MNPLETIYASIADLFENSVYLAGLLKKGNIVRYDLDPEQIDDYTSADTPRLEIIPVVGTENNYRVTTDDVSFNYSIRLVLSTDTLAFSNHQYGMLNFHWKILQTLMVAGSTLGCRYIIEYRIGEWTPVESEDRTDDRSDAGWQSESVITLMVRIPTEEVRSI